MTIEELQEQVTELKKALDAEKGKKDRILDEKKSEQAGRRELEDRLKEFEDAKKAADEKAAIEKGEFEKVMAARDRELADAKNALDALTKGSALQDGLATLEIAPGMRRGVEALHADKVSIVDGKAVIDGKDPADYFKEWAGTDEGKAYVVAKNSGGDSKPSTPGAKSTSANPSFSGSPEERRAAIAAKFPDLK